MNFENAVVNECLRALAYNRIQILDPKHWSRNPPPFKASDPAIEGVAWRNNTGVAKFDGKRLVRFGVPGSPDIEGIFRGGRRFGFEVKYGKRKPTEYQVWYHEFFSGLGMYIAIVRSYDDVIKTLNQWRAK